MFFFLIRQPEINIRTINTMETIKKMCTSVKKCFYFKKGNNNNESELRLF